MRRMLRPGAALLSLVFGTVACSRKAEDAGAARTVTITMERTPCFGSCPVYRLGLDGTGKVVYEGRGFVKERGARTATVPARDVQALAQEIDSIGFFSLRDSYPPDATDNASVITTVTIDGKTKRVEHNLSSRSAPATLEALYRRIDDVGRSKEWVGESAKPRPGEKGGGPDTARKAGTR